MHEILTIMSEMKQLQNLYFLVELLEIEIISSSFNKSYENHRIIKKIDA